LFMRWFREVDGADQRWKMDVEKVTRCTSTSVTLLTSGLRYADVGSVGLSWITKPWLI